MNTHTNSAATAASNERIARARANAGIAPLPANAPAKPWSHVCPERIISGALDETKLDTVDSDDDHVATVEAATEAPTEMQLKVAQETAVVAVAHDAEVMTQAPALPVVFARSPSQASTAVWPGAAPKPPRKRKAAPAESPYEDLEPDIEEFEAWRDRQDRRMAKDDNATQLEGIWRYSLIGDDETPISDPVVLGDADLDDNNDAAAQDAASTVVARVVTIGDLMLAQPEVAALPGETPPQHQRRLHTAIDAHEGAFTGDRRSANCLRICVGKAWKTEFDLLVAANGFGKKAGQMTRSAWQVGIGQHVGIKDRQVRAYIAAARAFYDCPVAESLPVMVLDREIQEVPSAIKHFVGSGDLEKTATRSDAQKEAAAKKRLEAQALACQEWPVEAASYDLATLRTVAAALKVALGIAEQELARAEHAAADTANNPATAVKDDGAAPNDSSATTASDDADQENN